MIQNIWKPFHNKKLIFLYILLTVVLFFVWWTFTDIEIMYGNYGSIHTNIDIFLSLFMILGFPLFLVGILHKGLLFGSRENVHKKTGFGILSGLLGTIISGASCCGSTLAIFFGLTPIMSLFPYDGLELKILSVFGLLYALNDLYTHLETCRIGKKK
ncbi:hypothetical protein KBB25_02990 [Candidatus Gracilibacteria bacterium]|nr:hypothetical protein [Candidatus Gracilibacteria bacterium]